MSTNTICLPILLLLILSYAFRSSISLQHTYFPISHAWSLIKCIHLLISHSTFHLRYYSFLRKYPFLSNQHIVSFYPIGYIFLLNCLSLSYELVSSFQPIGHFFPTNTLFLSTGYFSLKTFLSNQLDVSI